MSALWRVLRRILKWFGITVLGLITLACALLSVGYLINAHDEPLSAQARALLTPPPNPYRPEDNIYLATQGFDAPPGRSVIAAGQAKIERYNQNVDAVLRDPSGARLTSLNGKDPHALEFTGDISFVQPFTTSVWGGAAQHQAEVRKLLADNGELYQRYLALLPLPGYYETARPSAYEPYAIVPSQVHKLFLAAIALHMRSQFSRERDRALADLQLDARLWRTVFDGEGSLISKLVAVALLQEDCLLLADMIADPEVTLPLSEQDRDALVPVYDPKSWDLGSAFAAEFRISSSMLRQTNQLASDAWVPNGTSQSGVRGWLNRLSNRLGWHFFKLNATENLLARQTARRMRAAADPASFYRSKAAPGGLFPESESLWAHGYNPLGKILVAISRAGYDNYSPRVWDAAALQRLVRLSYEIRRERIDAAAIPAFLKQHPEWSTHPADGRPFLWDAAKGELRVQTVAQQPPDRRFSIPVWKLTPIG